MSADSKIPGLQPAADTGDRCACLCIASLSVLACTVVWFLITFFTML